MSGAAQLRTGLVHLHSKAYKLIGQLVKQVDVEVCKYKALFNRADIIFSTL